MHDIEQQIRTPLYASDIKRMLNNKIKILKYPELKKFKNIDDLLYPYDAVIILYEQIQLNSGHWVLLQRLTDGVIEFFDSYGFHWPGDELLFVSNDFRKMNDMKSKYLYDLLFKNNNYQIEQNDNRFQRKGDDIATCGYWCVSRKLFNFLTLDEFKELFLDGVSDPDKTVVCFLNLLLSS